MTNSAAFSGLRALVAKGGRILLTGPEDPDGDSIGACLALARAIEAVSSDAVQVEVAGEPGHRYAWMPGAEGMVSDDQVADRYDVAVVMDGDRHRLPPGVDRAFQAAGARAIVDHHGTTSPEGYDVAILDRGSASTCEMVLKLLDEWGVGLDRDIAALLYAGILFDTGGFRYSNTRTSTHHVAARLLEEGIDHADIAVRVLLERRRPALRVAARILDEAEFHHGGEVALGRYRMAVGAELGAEEADLEGIVDSLLYTEGVEVAVLIVERGPERVKLSLRSRGMVDVAQLASQLHPSGGGHAKAAGVLLQESVDATAARLPAVLTASVEQARNG